MTSTGKSAGKAGRVLALAAALGILVPAGTLLADTITYVPGSPSVEQEITFTYHPVITPGGPIRWDYGDGTYYIAMPMVMVSYHRYTRSGTFQVRAQAQVGGAPAPIATATVTAIERRTVTFTPANPMPGQPVTFRANNFFSTGLQWDFDDGPPYGGGPVEVHTFRQAGTHRVVVKDWDGKSAVGIVATLVVGGPAPAITYLPADPRPNETVEFQAVNFRSTTLIRWDFGDGTVENDASPPVITHVYRAPGGYLVRAFDAGGTTETARISVRILPGRAIEFSPTDPRAGEEIAFQAVNFSSTTLVRWDFGDGTVLNDTSPPSISHVYDRPGVFVVRAYDGGSTSRSARVDVRVLPERMITFAPPDPRVGEEITFQAMNFRSPTLRWDFGDGTVISAGPQVTHAFASAGPWTVRAADQGGAAEIVKSVSLTVFPAQGPQAKFAVSYLVLRFDDGKPYKVVPREFGGLVAYAEIKFEGTGVLQAQWLVDGMPFKTVFTNLSFAGTTVIDSGTIPGLPSLIPGLHEVTLSLMQPQAEFVIPVIRYFVTADAEPRPAVDFLLDGAVTIEGASLGGDGATIEAPVGAHFLLKGWIRNESGSAVSFALLRVFLDDELVDQKIVLGLKPGEERAFSSSVFNPTAGRKRLLLSLYDISRRPPAILYIRELAVVPPR